ncbi:hypothetical protein EH183_41715 [Streptomyces sp. CB01881]|uniref:hypothetical protein n=1 Tax=Streptomyces sp. CB01881 TaxID=2078691 RepID=UPI0011DF4F02|nr:hypothetical protein [Streptomyces sp. CB01881]TYC66726.1 hypothetical protein EH183_41715 [Streptomyces sp. CB01881]
MSSWDDYLAPSGGETAGSDEALTGLGDGAVEEELAEAARELLDAELAAEGAQYADIGDLVAGAGADDATDVYAAAIGAELQASAEEAALDLVSDDDAFGGDSY